MAFDDGILDDESFSSKIGDRIVSAFNERKRLLHVYNHLDKARESRIDGKVSLTTWLADSISASKLVKGWRYLAFPKNIPFAKINAIDQEIRAGYDFRWAPYFNFAGDEQIEQLKGLFGSEVFYFRYIELQDDGVKLYRIPVDKDEIAKSAKGDLLNPSLNYKTFLACLQRYLPDPIFD